MKTKLISRLAVIATLAFAFFMVPSISKAQNAFCPFTIQNNLSCPVDVDWITSQITSCTGICNTSGGTITIPGGGSTIIPCASFCGTGACNVSVNVTNVGGVPPSPNPINVNFFTQSTTGVATAGCNAITVNWSPTGVTIN